eukprot:4058950-Alexandrium_andersonii.AAC.1
MSASLVGSEMCIRDRGKGMGAEGARNPARALQTEPFRRPLPCPNVERRTCLLYTSDAADDM